MDQEKVQVDETSSSEREAFEIVVLGAGVIGLTTAIELQQRGKERYRVTIVADAFHEDSDTGVKYTSQWAGANHLYNPRDRSKYPNDELYRMSLSLSLMSGDSLIVMKNMKRIQKCFLQMPQTMYYYSDDETKTDLVADTLTEMSSYQAIPQDKLPSGAVSGCTIQILSIDTPVYLDWLFKRFISLGGRTVRSHIQHLGQIIEGGTTLFDPSESQNKTINNNKEKKQSKLDALVVCTGLGARSLGGVEDQTMFPVRGQTVIVHAPWVRFGMGEVGKKDENGEEILTYVIPRRSGDVVVGGTIVVDDWYPQPREATKLDILTRALKLCPELVSPEVRAVREPTINDLLQQVVGEGCGLRPARKGGIRIESEWRNRRGKPLSEGEMSESGKVLVVYNYGHAGYGYQSSWGTARKASDILEESLQNI
ncbi:hypothetical protein NP233_g7761 [Leucocoprinus birnbaumii]|uniref:FAD dependent oxidoreductase domain-containing protein n=1 Tax=Leucocoprinus birnbaumii TaxID=56174 RepID=A0AAD5YUF2_9AGAR|nr:hypothetical protein NP233_g7761 [Leucocoprinus birnbaumii]